MSFGWSVSDPHLLAHIGRACPFPLFQSHPLMIAFIGGFFGAGSSAAASWLWDGLITLP